MIISSFLILSIRDWRAVCNLWDRFGWRHNFLTYKCLILLILISSSISAYSNGVNLDGILTIELSSSLEFRKWNFKRNFRVKSYKSLSSWSKSDLGVGQNDIPLHKSSTSSSVSTHLLMLRTRVGPNCFSLSKEGVTSSGPSSFLDLDELKNPFLLQGKKEEIQCSFFYLLHQSFWWGKVCPLHNIPSFWHPFCWLVQKFLHENLHSV